MGRRLSTLQALGRWSALVFSSVYLLVLAQLPPRPCPRLAGGALTLRAMRLGRTFGTPGSELEIVLEFATFVPGFSSVELQMAGESPGDPVEAQMEVVAVPSSADVGRPRSRRAGPDADRGRPGSRPDSCRRLAAPS